MKWFRQYAGFDSSLGTTIFPNFLIRAFVGNSQWGWLPHVEIDHRTGVLTLGAEIRFHRSTHWGKISFAENLPPNFDPNFHFYEYNGEKNILSLYGHELYRVNDDLTVMTDLQFIYNRYSIKNEKFLDNTFSVPYYFLNPRVGINDNFNQYWNGYVSVAYTSHEPTLRNLYAAEDAYLGATPQFVVTGTTGGTVHYNFSQPLAKPERLLDIELGTSYTTSSVHASADMYWMEFTDELVENGQLDIFGQAVTGNAQRTRHIGFEFDGMTALNNALTISGNFTLSHNRLIHYSTVNGSSIISLDGNPIAGFPDFLANVRLTYHNDVVTGSLITKYVGPFYTDNFKSEANKNNDYTVFNIELLYRLPRIINSEFILRAEIRNLFDRLYFANGIGNSFYPAAERNYLLGITANL